MDGRGRPAVRGVFLHLYGAAPAVHRKKEFGGPQVSRVVHDLDAKDLLERGMVEEFTTAAERHQAERRAACGTV